MAGPSAEIRQKRNFLPANFQLEGWESIEPFYTDLNSRNLSNRQQLEQWLRDWSELEAILSEDAGWRYIHMSIDTADEDALSAYQHFISEIQPNAAPFDDAFNRKLMESSALEEIEISGFDILRREIEKSIELYRESNIEVKKQIAEKSREFGAISGAQSIELNGEEVTMQRAGAELRSTNRQHRKEVYERINARRLKDKGALHKLLTELVTLRHKVAINADYPNYRDYKFREMGRFDYSVGDCEDFHESIAAVVTPIVEEINTARQAALGLDRLRPYDLEVDAEGREPLKPFESVDELVSKSLEVFRKVRPKYAEYISEMNRMGNLDLGSKPGKMPGGYNYPLYETGIPFIFMNAVGTHHDLNTMFHEGGHAIHSFLSRDLPLTASKSLPSEIAELASMSMELITMDYWDVVYHDPSDLKRAKKGHFEQIFKVLQWVVTVDSFQHWLYVKHDHTHSEREDAWIRCYDRFSSGVVDFSEYEETKRTMWQRQLHIYEVPFYYIEYAIAQLGAIAVWKNYKENKEQALDMYEAALSMGYTKSIPEVYKAAGIDFNFSKDYIQELVSFVQLEMNKL